MFLLWVRFSVYVKACNKRSKDHCVYMSSLEGDQRPNSSFRSLRDDHYWSFVLWRHVNVLLWYVSMALQHQWHINWRKSPIISHTSIRELEYIVWQGFMVEKQSIWIECYECLIRWLSNWGASLCIESHDLSHVMNPYSIIFVVVIIDQ